MLEETNTRKQNRLDSRWMDTRLGTGEQEGSDLQGSVFDLFQIGDGAKEAAGDLAVHSLPDHSRGLDGVLRVHAEQIELLDLLQRNQEREKHRLRSAVRIGRLRSCRAPPRCRSSRTRRRTRPGSEFGRRTAL